MNLGCGGPGRRRSAPRSSFRGLRRSIQGAVDLLLRPVVTLVNAAVPHLDEGLRADGYVPPRD